MKECLSKPRAEFRVKEAQVGQLCMCPGSYAPGQEEALCDTLPLEGAWTLATAVVGLCCLNA